MDVLAAVATKSCQAGGDRHGVLAHDIGCLSRGYHAEVGARRQVVRVELVLSAPAPSPYDVELEEQSALVVGANQDELFVEFEGELVDPSFRVGQSLVWLDFATTFVADHGGVAVRSPSLLFTDTYDRASALYATETKQLHDLESHVFDFAWVEILLEALVHQNGSLDCGHEDRSPSL